MGHLDRKSLRVWTVAVTGALSAIVLTLATTWEHGAGTTPDSANYVAAAQSLLAGEGFLRFEGSPLILWPPLYPILLAGASFVSGLTPLGVAPWLGALSYAVFVATSAHLFYQLSGRSIVATTVAASLLVASQAYPDVFRMAWSETSFLMLSAGFLLAANRLLAASNEGDGRQAIIWMGITAALAALTRYVGVVFIGAGALVVLTYSAGPLRSRLTRSVAWSGAVAAPLTAWLTRNAELTGTITGPRAQASRPFFESVQSAAEAITSWVHPTFAGGPLAFAFLATLVFAFLTALTLAIRPLFGTGLARSNGPPRPAWAPAVPAALTGTAYLALVFYSAATTHFDSLNSRLMLPVLLPALCVLLVGLDRLIAVGHARPFLTASVQGLALLFAVAVATFATRNMAVEVPRAASLGIGFAGWDWGVLDSCSDTFVPSEATLYSNYPEAIFLHLGRPAMWMPAANGTAFHKIFGREIFWTGIERWHDHVAATPGPHYVLWFDRDGRKYFIPIDQVTKIVHLSKVATCGEGTLYRVAPQSVSGLVFQPYSRIPLERGSY